MQVHKGSSLNASAITMAAIQSQEWEQKHFSDTVQVWIERFRHRLAGSIITFSLLAKLSRR